MSATEMGVSLRREVGSSKLEAGDQPLVSVCAWCWPLQQDYFRAHPEHAGRALTHTICQRHKSEVLNGTYDPNRP